LAEWNEFGGPLETGSLPPATGTDQERQQVAETASRTTTVISQSSWGSALVDFIDRQPTSRLFLFWIAMTLVFGLVYWTAGLLHHSGLFEGGKRLDGSVRGLVDAIYFSFITVTSVGYGDILPHGIARILAVAEAIAGLLLFGAVVSKFVSRRQDRVVQEIHRVTFDERLDRIQTNLHMVLSELQWVATMFAEGRAPVERINARLESTALVFAAELRTVHYLLFRPQQAPEEAVLAGILAGLCSALNTLEECLHSAPNGQPRTPVLDHAVQNLSRLAGDICATCVPAVYAPTLTVWMDEIHATAARIA
jgi:hypothetical protein